MKFTFYVLNYDFNKRKVINFNIFQNCLVQEETEKCVKRYLIAPKKYTYTDFNNNTFYGFEGLREEIRHIIAWQEHARREYEISIGDAFEQDVSKLEKWDCYMQALPNIEIIAHDCIRQYKDQRKNNDKEN